MNPRLLISLLAICALGSCGDFPKDPRSTLDRIRTERLFHVGLVSSGSNGNVDPAAMRLIGKIGGATQASPQLVRGETEVLLSALEEGQLDLVIGDFEKKSPWAARVTFGPPLKTQWQGKSELQLKPAMRNGENAWIAAVEREARNLAPFPR